MSNRNSERSEGFAIGTRVRAKESVQGLVKGEPYLVKARYSKDKRVQYVLAHDCHEIEVTNLPDIANKVEGQVTIEERAESMYREDSSMTSLPHWHALPETIKARYRELAAKEAAQEAEDDKS